MTKHDLFLLLSGTDPSHPKISVREWEVLNLLADDLLPSEIAEKLGISLCTVRTHIAHLHQKFNVRNRVKLLRTAKQLGYLTCNENHQI